MSMPRHPFEYISRRYSLGSLLLAMTILSVVFWLATFDVGRFLLGIFVAIGSLLLAIACWSWIFGTFGERQRCERNTTAAPTDDDESQSADWPQSAEPIGEDESSGC